MEKSGKKSGGVKIPKRNRSLDIKGLYKSRVSKVGGSKGKGSQGNDQQNGQKKRRRSKKELSLSRLELDAKKRKKEDVDGVEPKHDSSQKSSSGSEVLHGVSFSLGENGNAFKFPKRPRGTAGRKKLETDQTPNPLGFSESGDHEGAFNAGVMDEAGLSSESGKLDIFSVGNDGVSKSKSAVKEIRSKQPKSVGKAAGSNSKYAGKVGNLKSKSAGKVGNLKSKSAGKVGNLKSKSSGKDAGSSSTKSLRKVGDSKSKSVGKAASSGSKLKQKADSVSISKVISSNVKLKRKVGADEIKENESGSICEGAKENFVAVNSGDTPSKKCRTNNKDLADGKDGRKASKKKAKPSMGIPVSDKIITDFDEDNEGDDDDDEENLEQNAARMLSSRFDPSCTGFPSKRKPSASQRKASESTFPVSSTLHSSSQQVNSAGGLYAALVGEDSRGDDQSRALRPRREDQGLGVPRKRRHYYDISPKDLEPQLVLNRKIKVFWPLDESWYFGHVNDYHPECRLYHIKYDDRDEEWVDLNEEKFQLLMYASEVPGRNKPRKFSKVQKDAQKVKTVPFEDINNSIDADPDSETIASWLARSSQRGKSLPESLKTQGNAHMELLNVAPRLSKKTGNLLSEVAEPEGRSDADSESASTDKLAVTDVIKSVMGGLITNHLVYARKKSQTSSEGNCSVSRYVKAYESALGTINPVEPISVSLPTTESVDSDEQLWLLDHRGRLWLNVELMKSNKFTFQLCLPSLPYDGFSLQTAESSLLHDIFMVKHGVLLPTSSSAVLEMLLIDSYRGLNFFLFEGSKKQALAFVFEILVCFSEAGALMDCDMQSPVTSIRFRLTGAQDLENHLVFELHSFSGLESSKWVCLDSKLLQHCILLKQVPTSKCTYDNIKELEYWSSKQCEPHVSFKLSSYVGGPNKESALGILPSTVYREACTTRRTSQWALYLSEKPGEISSFVLLSSARPTFLLTQRLQLLMESSSTRVQRQHDLNEHSSESLPAAVTSLPPQPSDHGSESRSDHMIVDISSIDQVGAPLDGRKQVSKHASEVARSLNEGFDPSPKLVGTQCSLRGRNSSISSPPGDSYPKWIEGTPKFMRRGFSIGPKKPRSQVQYALPGADYDFSIKQKMQNQRSVLGKRIKRDSLKRTSNASTGSRKNFELLVCNANVLVTCGDKGWRECGALIVLEVAEHNEWRLAVKLSGITKYSYKVNNILQPGSTNRYSHAVLWKGGKDWVLEFTDRSQWNLFKEMHEECYNRNVRAASVKNIPIPGVQLIEECDDLGIEAPFIQNPAKYLRQLQNDVEIGMDPSRVLYDMDSDDEQWLMSNLECDNEEVSMEFLEKTMDIFEKASYVKHHDNFTDDELQELVAGMESVEAVKLVYKHWREKRERKGMPLLRHFQPPLWEKYQHQLKEWEATVAQGNSVGVQEKAPVPEKPPMFAFCLKPRGLDVRNKSFKQRSHRKFPLSGHLHPVSGDQDSFYLFGRRSNVYTYGNEKPLYQSSTHESSDISPLPPSMRLLSPRDAHYTLSAAVSVASPSPRIYRSTKRRKHGRHPATDIQQTPPARRRKVGCKNGIQPRNMGMSDSSSQIDFYSEGPKRPSIDNMDESNLSECRLREASAAAHHALKVAKLKRERAQILFEKADVAVQKAVLAIMTTEAIKAAHDSMNGGGS